ncbi:hemicentin-1 [Rhipicephalus sanguineus]|uniref:hemicentin-1 n=1 Tax=Rhipicephalus sanguineus TaxID=34632 RepID=UPI0020C2D320|nr:hemicentin-1 [Rhipicephalus sanguineus]
MHNEKPMPEETYASEMGDGVSELVLDSIAQRDQGSYTCVAENGAGQHKATANVVVGVSPVIAEAPPYTEVAAGGDVWLHCTARGDPAPKVFWLRDGHQVDNAGGRIRHWDNGSLHIEPVEVDDAGEYYCLASNKFGMVQTNLSLSVLTPPSFDEPPEDVVVREEEPAALKCIASGLPAPTYAWFRVGQGTVQTSPLHNGTLHIMRAQRSDEGLYRCQASNVLGTATAEARLILRVDGNWSEWSEWSDCNCDGLRNRTRRCDSPPPRNGGEDCVGEALETETCEDVMCPPAEEPDKAFWGPWSPCSTSCGPGLKERTCMSTASGQPWNGPVNSSSDCEGRMRDVVACFESSCPVNGGWGPWSEWSACSASCGGGTRTRRRSCDSPVPMRGGRQCQGEPEQEDFCHPEACPVHGGWSEWSPWGECSASCGRRRHRRRFRTCDNPSPAAGGRGCLGTDHETRRCPHKPCPQAPARASTNRPWTSALTAGDIEELRSAPISAFIKEWTCPEGYFTKDGACVDEDECRNDNQCQHKCMNTPGSYQCMCPVGYKLGDDGHTCHDVDECRELELDCGHDHACFNTRGAYECVHVPCPAGYERDALEISCRLRCSHREDCGSDRTDVVTYASVALPRDVLAGAPVARLVARDHDGAALRHTDFSSLSGDAQPFNVRDGDSGVGLVFATRDLQARKSYRVTLHAVSRDEANSTVLFTTRFFLHITTGTYPF